MDNYKYPLEAFGRMTNAGSRGRVEAYLKAMETSITPETMVLEIGTGFGFFAMLACKMGARHVYAVEPNPLIQLGPELAKANGVADRITFIQDISTQITLPELADVIVSDMRSALPWLADHIPSVVDARTRLLKPGGTLIPQQDKVWIAIAHLPEQYEQLVAPWEQDSRGLNLASLRHRSVNQWDKVRAQPNNLMSAPQCWATLDYATITDPSAKQTLQWTVEQSGVGHGLLSWFDAELLPGATMSNNPNNPLCNNIYSQRFFPWEYPVELAIGDRVEITIEAKWVNSAYEWSWQTIIQDVNGNSKAEYSQSTVQSQL